jgi:hypothetical protein
MGALMGRAGAYRPIKRQSSGHLAEKQGFQIRSHAAEFFTAQVRQTLKMGF